jgi:hypothetical protein
MLDISIGELAELTGGKLLWSDLPPVGGSAELVRRLTFDTRRVRPGDVLWCTSASCWDHPAASAEAFRRGAAGVVGERFAAPWAGTFSLQVADAGAALCQLAAHARQQFGGKLIAVAAGNQTASLCRILDAVLRPFAAGGTCPILRRRERWLPSGLVDLRRGWDYALLPLFNTEKDAILRLSYPQVAVITRPARCGTERLARQILPWLPDSGQLIEVETIREAAVQVASALEIPESAVAPGLDRALGSLRMTREKAA